VPGANGGHGNAVPYCLNTSRAESQQASASAAGHPQIDCVCRIEWVNACHSHRTTGNRHSPNGIPAAGDSDGTETDIIHHVVKSHVARAGSASKCDRAGRHVGIRIVLGDDKIVRENQGCTAKYDSRSGTCARQGDRSSSCAGPVLIQRKAAGIEDIESIVSGVANCPHSDAAHHILGETRRPSGPLDYSADGIWRAVGSPVVGGAPIATPASVGISLRLGTGRTDEGCHCQNGHGKAGAARGGQTSRFGLDTIEECFQCWMGGSQSVCLSQIVIKHIVVGYNFHFHS